jgi:hypothetical protein
MKTYLTRQSKYVILCCALMPISSATFADAESLCHQNDTDECYATFNYITKICTNKCPKQVKVINPIMHERSGSSSVMESINQNRSDFAEKNEILIIDGIPGTKNHKPPLNDTKNSSAKKELRLNIEK